MKSMKRVPAERVKQPASARPALFLNKSPAACIIFASFSDLP